MDIFNTGIKAVIVSLSNDERDKKQSLRSQKSEKLEIV